MVQRPRAGTAVDDSPSAEVMATSVGKVFILRGDVARAAGRQIGTLRWREALWGAVGMVPPLHSAPVTARLSC